MNPSVAHVGIAVTKISDTLRFYRDVLGLAPGQPESADGATIVSLPFGDIAVELLEPSDPQSPVAKFLAKRGPGIHHICNARAWPPGPRRGSRCDGCPARVSDL